MTVHINKVVNVSLPEVLANTVLNHQTGKTSSSSTTTNRSMLVEADFKEGFKSPFVEVSPGVKFRAPTPYKRMKETWTHTAGVMESITSTTYSTTTKKWSGHCYPLPYPDIPNFWNGRIGSVDYNQESRAIMEAMSKVADGKVSLSMLAAEAKESFGLLASVAIPFLRVLQHLRRGQWAQAAALLDLGKPKHWVRPAIRNWHDFYLAYKLGWKPLVSELYNLYELSREKGLKLEALVNGRRSILETSPGKSGTFDFGGSRYEHNSVAERRYIAAFTGKLDLLDLHNASRIGVINPVTVAWELVPLSFVVDWVLPIGGFLETLTSLMGIRFHSGTLTRMSKRETTVRRLAPATGGWTVIVNPRSVYERIEMDRVKLTHWPLPRIYVKNPFSTDRIVTAVALFSQARSPIKGDRDLKSIKDVRKYRSRKA